MRLPLPPLSVREVGELVECLLVIPCIYSSQQPVVSNIAIYTGRMGKNVMNMK